MFILHLTYIRPLSEADQYLEEHRAVLNPYYESGEILCSGPCVPRNGGVILCRFDDRAKAEKLVADDPFTRHGIAEYRIIEFTASRHIPGFEIFL